MNESYASLNFGKPLTQIKREDLLRFFSIERDESDTLEFKSYFEKNQTNHNHKEAAVLKTICAFLNSSGGMLIWGAPVGQTPEGRQTKVFTGDLSPVPRLIEKDTFISRIATAIVPLSNLVKMHRVEMEPDLYVYIYDVEQSHHKPHQFDNRYWVRLDGQTGTAPHYLIDALFKQIRYPDLGGYIKFGRCTLYQRNVLDLELKLHVINHSRYQNEYDLYYMLGCDEGTFVPHGSEGIYEQSGHLYRRDEVAKILSYSHGPTQNMTLRVHYGPLMDQFNGRIEVMLTFGGRLSPMKRSSYILDFKDFNGFGPSNPKPIDHIFTISREVNVQMVATDLTEEERVRWILDN